MDKENTFNYDMANLADQISVIGFCEHVYDHCCKSAAVSKKEDAVFYMTIADMIKEYRRNFMKKHFPNVKDEDWCLLKSIEQVRQRVYESAHTSYEDLKGVNDIWSEVTEHIFGVDMSGCVACEEDRKNDDGETDERISEEEARKRWPDMMREADKMFKEGSH